MKGGKIKGEYPKSFNEYDPTNIGRGRLIPTTSWDALFYGLTQWMGITVQDDIDVSCIFYDIPRLDPSDENSSYLHFLFFVILSMFSLITKILGCCQFVVDFFLAAARC